MSKFKLRDYQVKAVKNVFRNIENGILRIIVSAPTGSGKTEIAIAMTKRLLKMNYRVEFIADRKNLVNQTSKRFGDAGVKHGILMGDSTKDIHEQLLISSAQTIESRGLEREVFKGIFNFKAEVADVYIIDECQEMREILLKLLREAGNKIIIGLTATPFPERLAFHYEVIVHVETTTNLMNNNFLSNIKVASPLASEIKTKGIPIVGGEFSKGEVTERILKIVGEIVPDWEKLCEEHFGGPKQTLVFAASIADANYICDDFVCHGYDFRVVSSNETTEHNEKIIEGYRNNEFLGLVNCAMLTRGSDFPSTFVLLNCYPVRSSFKNVIQKFGRLLRVYEGKEYGLLIDPAGDWNAFREDIIRFYRYGWPDLSKNYKLIKRRKRMKNSTAIICIKCRTVYGFGERVCSVCGTKRVFKGRYLAPKYIPEEGRLEVTDEMTGETFSDEIDLWREICTANMEITRGDSVRAQRRSRPSYKSITGKWAKGRFWPYKNREADPTVKKMVEDGYKAWAREQYKNRAKK